MSNNELSDDEIIFQLYCILKDRTLKEAEEEMVLDLAPRGLMCHSCMKRIKPGKTFISFHDVHEAIRYVKYIECWKEKR